jgi:long-chain acyl-CoA synthetase
MAMTAAVRKLQAVAPPQANRDAAARVLPALFREWAVARRDKVLLRERKLGVWQSVTWSEAAEAVDAAALGLIQNGLARGGVVCILSNNRSEWLYADLAIMSAGGISAGIYPTSSPHQVGELLAGTQCEIVFVENDEQLDKVLQVRDRLPKLRRIVVFNVEGLHKFRDPIVLAFDGLLDVGRSAAGSRSELERRIEGQGGSDGAVIIFTSGTTGPAKSAVLTYENIFTQMTVGVELLQQTERDERLSFLPMCHAAERVVGCYFALYAGSISSFVEAMETLVEDSREISPTIYMAVPRVWEKLHSLITLRLEEATSFQRWAYRMAMAIAGRRIQHLDTGAGAPAWLKATSAIADAIVLRNIRRTIGLDRCRIMITGAAPTSAELVHWYRALGLTVREVYGQTEASGLITLMPADAFKPGSCGRVVPFHEVRIADDGEILLRGPAVFAGYLGQPAETQRTLQDGWLHTGDLGTLDDDRYLSIIGRSKDILITAGGKNLAPAAIENELKFSPYIADAVVIGDGRPFLTCLVMIDFENVARFAYQSRLSFTDYGSLCRLREVEELIWREIQTANSRLARVETIKKFRLIDRNLTTADSEVTPTMKLKRQAIAESYRPAIEAMYLKDE